MAISLLLEGCAGKFRNRVLHKLDIDLTIMVFYQAVQHLLGSGRQTSRVESGMRYALLRPFLINASPRPRWVSIPGRPMTIKRVVPGDEAGSRLAAPLVAYSFLVLMN